MPLAGPQHAVGGQHPELHHAGRVRGRSQGAGRDPPPHDLVVRAAGVEPLPAAVRHLPRRLEQEQAAVRVRGKDAPAAGLAGDRGVVEVRIKPEQRELEPVLAARLPVAPAGVAPELAQQRLDLGPEVHRPAGPEPGDADGHFEPLAAALDADDGAAVAGGRDVPRGIDGRHGRVRGRVLRLAGDVASGVGDEQLPALEGVAQLDLGDGARHRGGEPGV